MHEYAKYISETRIDQNLPSKAAWEGRLVTGDITIFPGLPESLGFLPYDAAPMPEPPAGYHAEARYAVEDGRVKQSWVEVQDPPPPPRSLSKRKLYIALKAQGIWAAVKSYMEAAGCWEDFSLATTLDEDDPLIVAAIAALKVDLGLTDEQVAAIIDASVVGDGEV